MPAAIDRRHLLVGCAAALLARATSEAFPVHAILLTNNGIHIIENVRTDLIAADAASTNRATFFLSMTVPKAVGTTGTFVNIEAIR